MIKTLKHSISHVVRQCPAIAAVLYISTYSLFPAYTHADITWTEKESGLEFGSYSVKNSSSVLLAQVILIRVDPKQFSFTLSNANAETSERTDIRTLTTNIDGIIGINANFFDPSGKALGLLSKNGQVSNPIHRGGNVLTGLFYIHDDMPHIVHRFDTIPNNASIALQAGPRLIVNSKPTDLTKSTATARRSGIAVTSDSKVILFASLSPFPGIQLSDIQKMLLEPSVQATDALNLDGGSSSQIYISPSASMTGKELFFGGADAIPVGLVVKRRK